MRIGSHRLQIVTLIALCQLAVGGHKHRNRAVKNETLSASTLSPPSTLPPAAGFPTFPATTVSTAASLPPAASTPPVNPLPSVEGFVGSGPSAVRFSEFFNVNYSRSKEFQTPFTFGYPQPSRLSFGQNPYPQNGFSPVAALQQLIPQLAVQLPDWNQWVERMNAAQAAQTAQSTGDPRFNSNYNWNWQSTLPAATTVPAPPAAAAQRPKFPTAGNNAATTGFSGFHGQRRPKSEERPARTTTTATVTTTPNTQTTRNPIKSDLPDPFGPTANETKAVEPPADVTVFWLSQ